MHSVDAEKRSPAKGNQAEEEAVLEELHRQIAELTGMVSDLKRRQRDMEKEFESKLESLWDAVDASRREQLVQKATEIHAIKQMIHEEMKPRWQFWRKS